MADVPESNPFGLFWMVLGFMAILVGLWFASGAYKKADLRGVFLAPPTPLGPGNAYGPQIGHPASYSNQATSSY